MKNMKNNDNNNVGNIFGVGIFLLCCLLLCADGHGQSIESCNKNFQIALYHRFGIEYPGPIDEGLKDYIVNRSVTFKQDLTANKWGSSITVPINGKPRTLQSDATEEAVNAFISEIASDSEFTMPTGFYEALACSIPNVDFLREYE